MNHLIVLLILLFSTVAKLGSNKDYCSEKFSLDDLPHGLAKEVFSIITTGAISFLLDCEDIEPPLKQVKLFLYNRKNPDSPIELDSSGVASINQTLPTKVLLHGWLCSIGNDRMPELKNAYLKRYDANVIAVDWSANSVDFYVNAYCILPKIAALIARFLCQLDNVDDVHLVGHSLGGQLSGLVGFEVQKQCGRKVGRITGLDPAGPLYMGLPEERRLDASDAKFVDVIHSNGGFFGYFEACGSVDFFPNCGTFQSDCLNFRNFSFGSIMNTSLKTLGCSHLKSTDYMVASIEGTKKFVAQKCIDCPSLSCYGDNTVTTQMGEDCPVNPPGDNFYIELSEDGQSASLLFKQLILN